MIKKSRQNFKCLESEKSFEVEIKSIFTIFKGLSFAKNCLRLKIAPLKYKSNIVFSVFLSLDQNLMKLERHNVLFNKFT